MADDWSMEDRHVSSDEVDSSPEEDPVDHLDTFEINTGIISDTFRLFRRKAEKSTKSNRHDDHVTEGVDISVKRFLLENAATVDYRDLAKLIGVKPQDMKALLSQMGVKVPVAGARRWVDITFRTPDSQDCVRCAVQAKHSTFYAGIFECRQCFKENIEYLIEEGETINIHISDRME